MKHANPRDTACGSNGRGRSGWAEANATERVLMAPKTLTTVGENSAATQTRSRATPRRARASTGWAMWACSTRQHEGKYCTPRKRNSEESRESCERGLIGSDRRRQSPDGIFQL